MFSIKTYFTSTQIVFLLSAGFFFLISLYFQTKQKNSYALIFLLLTAFCVFSFCAILDNFLNFWDERFHALVAKNMLKHPLMPTLYDDPVLINYGYDYWDKYHIWVHKQPLFLWQIALSFKLFGTSVYSLRFPNIILGTILVYITYRSGKLLVNQRVGYIAAILVISTIYILELAAGWEHLDHNDFSFIVYVSLSLWSFFEYYYSKKTIWIYCIGLFSGMAILCKWLVGLLVFLGWITLRMQERKFKWSDNKDLIMSLFITILISLPWQFFIFINYPVEAAASYKFNILHFTQVLEGHDGNFAYHFYAFHQIYGLFASIFIIPSLYFLYKKIRDKKLFHSLLCMIIVVYLFFSLASTKMPSFTLVVSLIFFVALSTLLNSILDYFDKIIKNRNLITTLYFCSILILGLSRFDIETIQERHTLWKDNQFVRKLNQNREVFYSLKLPNNTVLFNIGGHHNIEAMFYTGLTAYNIIPTFEQYKDLKKKGKVIAIFNPEKSEIPDYINNDSTVIFVDKPIQVCD